MIWYLLNLLILTIVWLLPTDNTMVISDTGKSFRIRSKRLCFTAAVCWILLSGLRSLDVGPDTYNYFVNSFEPVKQMSWSEITGLFRRRYLLGESVKDPGYCLLEKIFQIFCQEYRAWLFFVAISFTVPLALFIYRYSSNPYLSFVLYAALFSNFFSVTGHRQTLSTAILLGIGLYAVMHKRFLMFVFSVLIACTIHPSSIAFLPVYFLARIKLRKNQLLICFAAVVLSFVLRKQILSVLVWITGYDSFYQVPEARPGIFMFLLLAFTLFISLFYNRTVESTDNSCGIIHLSYNALVCACFFSSLLLINPVFMRVVQYYSLFLLVLLPEGARAFGNGKGKIFYNLFCTALLVGLLVSDGRFYEFFWQ